MSVTEAERQEQAGDAAPTGDTVAAFEADGLAGVLGTGDHLALGRLFLVTSLLFLLVGRVAGVLVGVERLETSSISVLDEYLGQVFSLHLVADPFLFLLPAFVGIAIAVVPLQVGAATVAFPRAAAAAFWGWFLSGGVVLAAYLIDGGSPGAGTDRDGVLLWVVGLGGVVASLLVAVVCLVTTILALRTAGMSVDRVPMFTWATLIAGAVWLVSLPVVVAVLVLTYVDVRYGGSVGAGSRLNWAFGAPQVFAYALPVVGLLLDVVPVAAGTRLRNRGILLGAVAVAGVLTFGADTFEAAAGDTAIFQDALYVGASFAALLPLLAILGGVADTIRRGAFKLSSPLVFAVLGYLLFLSGVAVNAVRVIDNLDLVGTSADSAVAELAIVAGILGVAGAAHYWATKLFGAQLKDGVGTLAAVVLFVGGAVLAGPDLASGFLDQPYGAGALPFVEDGVEALNTVSMIGGLVVLAGVMLVILNLIAGRGGDDDGEVPADPWNGHTLEWATTSPPAAGGPGPIEPVTSPTPLLDTKEATS